MIVYSLVAVAPAQVSNMLDGNRKPPSAAAHTNCFVQETPKGVHALRSTNPAMSSVLRFGLWRILKRNRQSGETSKLQIQDRTMNECTPVPTSSDAIPETIPRRCPKHDTYPWRVASQDVLRENTMRPCYLLPLYPLTG